MTVASDAIASKLPHCRRSRPSGDPLIEEAWARRRRRRTRSVIVAVFIIALAASAFLLRDGPAQSISTVRASDTGASSTSPIIEHPCRLLTNLQVARAVDSKLAYRIPHPGKMTSACFWYFAPLGSFTSARPALFLMVSRTTLARFRSSTPFGVVPVSGLGQHAYWTPASAVRQLVVYENGYSVMVYASEVTNVLAVEKALAPLVLSRLH